VFYLAKGEHGYLMIVLYEKRAGADVPGSLFMVLLL
jgi:hypothetical protein